ncbi:MAG: 8-oxo-dGTP diphosphatase [Streptomyces sp.]|nr:8-oxo-dGTP diphosphatase [Streptomyces sp.]
MAAHRGFLTPTRTQTGKGNVLDTTATPVLAAGAVLWRRSPVDGGIELALIHRPRYDDWSFPKGKLKRGEFPATAAIREVKEETGKDCVLGVPLPSSFYVASGRPKHVRYWAAEATGGHFAPNREVDRMIWLPPVAARHRLTHERDRPLIDAFIRHSGQNAP